MKVGTCTYVGTSWNSEINRCSVDASNASAFNALDDASEFVVDAAIASLGDAPLTNDEAFAPLEFDLFIRI
tara:strand:+ start:215 stop:427 length:213 start_codon:yes stop_codon:yes gene_type:complete